MKKIEICLSPELIRLHDLKGKIVVVVDIFRATSTMVTGLANAVQSITPIAGLESCRTMKEEGYIIAGERNGHTAEGFELGNSPLSYLDNAFEGKKIAVTTTNGTLAIELSKKDADEVILGAFLNLQIIWKNKGHSLRRLERNVQLGRLLVCRSPSKQAF